MAEGWGLFPVRIISTNTLKEPETKQDKEDGMDDKRMIGDYTVLNSMYVGHKEIAICETEHNYQLMMKPFIWHILKT